MILSSCDFFGDSLDNNDFRKKMLLENNIPSLLPVKCRHVNGQTKYYYEINSLQSLERIYNKKEMDYEELKHILMGCVKLFNGLEEYLLDGSQIILNTEYIYMDMDKLELYFVYYPEYEGDVRKAFIEFIDMILTKIDHTDNDAVMLGYRVYRYTKNPNYIISEISKIIEASMPDDDNIPEPDIQYSYNYPEPVGYFEESEIKEETPKPEKKSIFNLNFKSKPKSKTKPKVNLKPVKKTKGKSSDMLGMIFSLLVALGAMALIGVARKTPSMAIVRNNELYLYGAVAMALVGALLFAISHDKKKKLEKAKAELNCDEEEIVREDYSGYNLDCNHDYKYEIPTTSKPAKRETKQTTYLNESTTEERVLVGRVNGEEVTIPLKGFPVTLGKQKGVSDIIVDDSAVSKMHARFEELDGRIYIYDLNSTNGTVKNGVMLDINSPVILESGDRLRFGRSCFTYC
jgi:hypothetical protein